MDIILKKGETLDGFVEKLKNAFDIVKDIAPVAYWYEHLHENGRIIDIHFSNRMREMLGYKSLEEFPDELNTLMTFTHPEDVQIMLQGAIDAGTGKSEKYDVEYRIRKASGEYMWCNATGLRVVNEEGTIVGMYGSFIDISSKKQKEATDAHIGEYAAFTRFFLDTYLSAYYINLDTLSCRVYKRTEELERDYPDVSNYYESIKEYIDKDVHPDDREELLKVIEPEWMRETLKRQAEYNHLFRDISYGKEKVYRMQVIRGAEENQAAFGFEDISEEVSAQHFKELTQNNQRIMALEDNLESLYDVDMESGNYRVYIKGDFYQQNVIDKLIEPTDFFEDLKENIGVVVFPDDRDGLFEVLNRDSLRKRLAETDRVEHFYRLFVGDKPVWLKVRVVYKDKEKKSIIVGVFNAEEEMAERLQREQDAQRNQAIVNGFSKEYSAVYFGNMEEDSYRILVRSESVVNSIKGTTKICDAIKTFAESSVYKPDVELFSKDLYSVEGIKAKIPVGESYVFEYRTKMGNDYLWYRADFRRLSENDLLVGFKDCTAEVVDRMVHDILINEYDAIYLVDLNRNEIQPTRKSRVTKVGVFEGKVAYDKILKKFADTVGIDYKKDWIRFSDTAYMKQYMATENHREYVYELPGTKKTMRRFNVDVIERVDGEAVMVLFSFMGIDDERAQSLRLHKQIAEQQEQLEEALSMAQSANRAKTTFLNNMSHDIRTPMNAIIGYTGLAASHIDNKEQVQDYLSKIGQASDHLLSLINDVLDMSRIESGKMHLEEKEENISDIIHTLRDIVQANIHSKQLDFFVDAVDVNDENIVCDKLRLNQVLLNVLSNAIKYTAAGGMVSMRVKERTVKRSGYATFEFRIKDNGMGMSREFLKTIFDPFTRVKSSTVSGIQGTGLGMAITKNIVDMMGGKIEIESEPCKGTEVILEFDFKLISAPKVPVVIPELDGVRSLIADDDSNTCLSIVKMVRDIGMRPDWCTSGKEAIIRAEAAYQDGDCFKVYIIDWMMPDMNGIETARRIRKVIGDDVPIIILTAYDWSDIEEEAREAGVTAFVSKPMFPSDLHRVLAKCLGKEEQEEEVVHQKKDFSLEDKKIMLVEDNELNREIATSILEEYGCQVFPAEDGDIAVELMREAKEDDYDLILMDIQMPVMDGYEATRAIRGLQVAGELLGQGSKVNGQGSNGSSGSSGGWYSRIPIIAMTANAFEEDRQLAMEAGMNEHIAKPINIDQLKEVLSKFLK